MKKLFILLAIVASTNAFAQQNPITGSWTQTSKEQLSGEVYVNAIPLTIEANAKNSQLNLTTTYATNDPEKPVTPPNDETLDLSGKTIRSLTPSKKTKVMTVKLAADQRSINKTARYSLPEQPEKPAYQYDETWTVSPDGNALTITRNYTSLTDTNDKWAVKGRYSRKN